jgi:hyperosmotically inducible protein
MNITKYAITALRTLLVTLSFIVTAHALADDNTSAGAEDKTEQKTKNVINKTEQVSSNAWITTKVKAALIKDKLTKAHEIDVDTDSNGVVTLTGNVESQAAIDQAVSLAKKVKGVTQVNSDKLAVGAY